MKRREFIQRTAGAAAVAGVSFSFPGILKAGIKSNSSTLLPYDLVAAKGGDPIQMFDKSIEAMGGMKNFVKPNQTVVIKPNIGWDKTPELAANTNPFLIERIVQHCIKAGAKKVYVFDHTCDEWTRCYQNSGIEKAVKDAGGTMVTGNSESHYQEVTIPKGKVLKSAKVHELILDSDVFINVPVLKNHGGAKMTISMKNLMGIVWDRRFWHRTDLQQCIADFATYRKPDLNVVDCYRVMKRNGPRGVTRSDVTLMKCQIMSNDIVAADAAATKLFGWQISDVKHITLADQLGAGTSNLDSLNVHRISLGE
jgi:uncharacterized protein (DUF362 family)